MNAQQPVREPARVSRWIGRIALKIDDLLRYIYGVRDYCHDPRCVLRMQPCKAGREIVLPDGVTLRRGDPIVTIHLWNEHVPEIPPDGPTISWGRKMGGSMEFSLRQLSAFMSERPEFEHIVAIRAVTAVATAETTGTLMRIMQHYGFAIVTNPEPESFLRRLHRFGENVLSLMFLTAVNPVSARWSVLTRVRSEVMQSRQALDRRYRAARAAGHPDRGIAPASAVARNVSCASLTPPADSPDSLANNSSVLAGTS